MIEPIVVLCSWGHVYREAKPTHCQDWDMQKLGGVDAGHRPSVRTKQSRQGPGNSSGHQGGLVTPGSLNVGSLI